MQVKSLTKIFEFSFTLRQFINPKTTNVKKGKFKTKSETVKQRYAQKFPLKRTFENEKKK